MRHRSAKPPQGIRQQRIITLCEHLRSAIDLLEEIGLDLGNAGESVVQPAPPAPMATASAPRPLPPLPATKVAYTIKEAVAALGIGRTSIYRLINAGELETTWVGGRRLVTAEAMQGLLQKNRV